MFKKTSLLILAALSSTDTAIAEAGPQKGFYLGAALGGSFLRGSRSDNTTSAALGRTFNLTNDRGLRDTSFRGELFLGYFFPFYNNKLGVSIEGVYAHSRLQHETVTDLNPLTGGLIGAPDFFKEKVRLSRPYYGGNLRFGPIFQEKHYFFGILGFERTKFIKNHVETLGPQFNSTSVTKTGFQYGLGYQFMFGNRSFGVEIRQTRYPSMTLQTRDNQNDPTQTTFKPNINTLMLRYTYRFY